jgi:nucleotide-binding universal stress UspA family protein
MSGRIVVGVDGSKGADAALRWALAEATLRGADVEAVLAWEYPYLDRLGRAVRDELQAQAEAHLAELVGPVTASLDGAPALHPRAVRGSPADALLAAGAHADLLVVGRRGRGGFTELLLGSVSSHCVHHAGCPVVIVPESGAAD